MSTQPQRFRTTGWERVRKAQIRVKPSFAAYMRRLARPCQIAYQQLMAAYNGEPIGIECLMGDRERWAFVVPEMSGDDRQWRVQYFDADGFVGHSCYETLPLAVETVIQEGYRTPDPGALDRVSRTPRWALGVKKAAIHQRCQQQIITFSQMIAEMKALEAEGI